MNLKTITTKEKLAECILEHCLDKILIVQTGIFIKSYNINTATICFMFATDSVKWSKIFTEIYNTIQPVKSYFKIDGFSNYTKYLEISLEIDKNIELETLLTLCRLYGV